jgi:hypothetical protein
MNAMVRAGLLVMLGVLMAAAFASAIDSDLSWQRALGDHVLRQHALPTTLGAATFTTPDARWIPHEWIFSTLWALTQRAGSDAAFRTGCALVAFSAVWIDALRVRTATPRAQAIALTLAVVGMLPSFGLRAQIIGWPLLALVLLALERGPRMTWWAVPIAVVWDNLHASGLIVPAIVLVHGFGRSLTERRPAAVLSTLVLAAATALASVATPFGFAYLTFAVAWSINPATTLITEWQPASLRTLPISISAFMIIGLLVAGELRGVRLSWSQRFLTLYFFAAALLHTRNIPLFCIVAGPWAAAALAKILPRESPAAAPMSRSDRGLIVLAAIGAVVLAVVGSKMSKADPQDPAPAVAKLVAGHRAARVACEDFSWCSRFAGNPKIRVLLDGRVDAYPDGVLAEYRKMASGDSAGVFVRWRIDAVLARRDGPLARSLNVRQWRRVLGGATQLFVRV